MELLLILTYTAICISIFKIFRIPINRWTVPTAALGGAVLIGALFVTMNYNHPYSENTRQYFFSTPITPDVDGIVIEVPVKPNSSLKKGDVLFKLDPRPFEYALESLKAQLTASENDLKRAQTLYKKNALAKRDLDLTREEYETTNAKFRDAQFDLENTIVKAPGDGYLAQLLLKPGMRAVPMPLRPLVVFVHKQPERLYVGWFRQNSLLRLEKGNKAEISFDALPGKIFSAEIVNVAPAIGEGQLQPSGDLVEMTQSEPGRIPVTMRIVDPEFSAYNERLPEGAYAQSAIYSEHAHHLAVLRKILLRMSAWMNYVFPIH